ncbi:MAG: sterol desaturase family protein [Burkholderiaceae bacterium]|nr:sterol desaturase family protein [Burkholderiaceae bacterium]
MNPILFAIPVFMLTILLEAWIARRRGIATYDIPDALTSLHHGILSQVSGLFLKIATLGIYVAIYESYRATELPANSVWVWLIALLAYDFFYYWTHRLGHEVNVLWAAHVVHHSSEYYNLSTALRQTSSGWLLGWLFYLPMAVVGVPPVVFIGVGLIDLLYQYWVHTELIDRMGWFDRVFVSPSNHRVHHGQNDYCIDRNYGGILILWDRLFGTFVDERKDEKIIYGIRKPLHSYNPLWGNLHHYADMWRLSRAAPNWRAKLGVWLMPPGGWHDEGVEHFDTSTFVRYTTHTPPAMRWYAVLQYAITVPFIVHLLAVAPNLDYAALSLYSAGIFLTTLSVGAVLTGGSIGRYGELVRVLALAAAFFFAPDWFGFVAPMGLKIAVLALLLVSAAWLSMTHHAAAQGAAA